MDRICVTPLWDQNLTWNTADPDFTKCFQNTILTWVPCGLFMLFLPADIYEITNNDFGAIKWNIKNAFKMVFLCSIIIVYLVDLFDGVLFDQLANENIAFAAESTSTVILLIVFLIVLILLTLNRRRGVQVSLNVFTFALLIVVAEAVRYRSEVIKILYHNEESNISRIGITFAKLPLLCGFFLLLFVNDGESENKYNLMGLKLRSAEDNCSPASYITFWWIVSLMKTGMSRTLLEDDVDPLGRTNCAVKLGEELQESIQSSSGPSIYRGLFRCFGLQYFVVTIFLIAHAILIFVNPLLMDALIQFAASDEYIWKGVFYATLFLIVNFFNTFLGEVCVYKFFIYAMKIKTALTAIIFRKSMKLSNKARQEWTSGEVVNMASVDVQRIQECLQLFFTLIMGVVQLIFSVYALIAYLGLSSLAGIGVLVILVPVNIYLSNVVNRIQIKFMKLKDDRVNMTSEVLGGIKVLKLYAWEQPFENLISNKRMKEVVALKDSLLVDNTFITVFIIAPFIVALVTFVSYVYGFGNILTPSVAFVSLSLFNIIRVPLADIPFLIGQTIKCYSSFERISGFINSEELQEDNIEFNKGLSEAILVKNGTFSWEKDAQPNLKNINMSVEKGKLVGVVGQIGSGKSSLMSALLGEMNKDEGSVSLNGRLAYIPQKAWIQNATVKENILFYEPFDITKYETIVDNCALRPDFEILVAGDQTEIGEKGANLSGGQKQRVSLARAVYNESDIYLFDDPLSAVDSHVGKHIFDKVIGPHGMLQNKTRVLVTHGLKFLPECDYIYMMKHGEVIEQGSYPDLMKNKQKFSELMDQYMETKDEDNDSEDSTHEEIILADTSTKDVKRMSFVNSTSIVSINESQFFEDQGKLIDDESVEEGTVSMKVYFHYFMSIGPVFFGFMIIGFGLTNVFDLVANEWLSIWSSDSLDPDFDLTSSLTDFRIGIYTLFGILQFLSIAIGLFVFTFGVAKFAQVTHNMALARIMRAPMSFFDTTPMGRILNRFSRDLNSMDTTLINETEKFIFLIWKILCAMIIICIKMPPFIAVAIVIAILYYLALVLSLRTVRQLMRLESIYRSPMYSYLQEAHSGVSSIRAYNVTDKFISKFYEKIDNNQRFYFGYSAVNGWLAVVLQLFGAFIVFFTALVAVYLRETIGSATVGLTLNYALSITLTIYLVVRSASIVEANVVSVERVLEYTRLPQEAEREILSEEKKQTWLTEGRIEFSRYKTAYREGLDLVLKGIDFNVLPSEKIGIVGRTGAGKSSLTLALFRIIEAVKGSISIDGVDISKIGLHDLRSKLTIIPQDPVLFSGTFRMNIDPFEKYSDDEVWSALEHAHLKEFASSLPSGLEYKIAEGGQNLSIGQRQLLCLARALLRHTKILILDEATAAIDLETDDLIQQTIRKEFKHCTILTIAHRLNTIMDSDRVLVLSDGLVAEQGSPSDLLSDRRSIFYKMAVDAGLV